MRDLGETLGLGAGFSALAIAQIPFVFKAERVVWPIPKGFVAYVAVTACVGWIQVFASKTTSIAWANLNGEPSGAFLVNDAVDLDRARKSVLEILGFTSR